MGVEGLRMAPSNGSSEDWREVEWNREKDFGVVGGENV